MHAAEAVPLRWQNVVVFALYPHWGTCRFCWEAEVDHGAHDVQEEVSAVVHYLQREEYC